MSPVRQFADAFVGKQLKLYDKESDFLDKTYFKHCGIHNLCFSHMSCIFLLEITKSLKGELVILVGKYDDMIGNSGEVFFKWRTGVDCLNKAVTNYIIQSSLNI